MPAISHERETAKSPIERIGDQHALMMRYVQSLSRPQRKRGELERLDARTFFPEEYAGMAFRPDIYILEPVAIDDLEAAKKQHNEKRIEALRSVIRAMSWTSHGRTDNEVASERAEDFLREAQAEATSEAIGHGKPQTGFEFAHPDLAEWSRVLNTLKRIECRGDSVEKPTRFIEKKLVDTWKELMAQYPQKKSKRTDWPTSYPVVLDPPKLSESVKHINERLIALRHIRDQLYYQLLFPKHCMYARQADTLKQKR